MQEFEAFDPFPDSYSEARSNFLEASQSSAAEIESFRNPRTGPDGTPLYVDVASIGPRDARELLVLCSGTHGIEGFCGSGIQYGLLKENIKAALTNRQRVLMIHALNPYGFAHLRRVNEDNVDLNRNFLDHSQPHPESPEYDALASVIAPEQYWPVATGASLALLRIYQITRGKLAVQTAVSSGQYDHPLGLFYGGTEDTWSNRTLRSIVRTSFSEASNIAFIDLHTGLGPFGQGQIMIDDPPGTPTYQRAFRWWGEKVKSIEQGHAVTPDVSGTISNALSKVVSAKSLTAVGVEFGTFSPVTVFRAMQAENWNHNHGRSDGRRTRKIKNDLRKVFFPDSTEWKQQVWVQAREIVENALNGLAETEAQ